MFAAICLVSFLGWSNFLVMKDQVEVCSLSREVIFQPLSAPLQSSLCFFHLPSSAALSTFLTVVFPSLGEQRSSHVPRTYLNDVGLACPPVTFYLRQDIREILN